MKTGICYVVGAGENYGLNFAPEAGDYVIAVDGGFQALEEGGIAADMVIGDFDSLQAVPRHPNVIRLNTEKDDTDMLAAVREGIRAGYGVFHIYCGTGGRIEHTIANIQLLADLAQGGNQGFLMGRDYMMTAIKNRTVTFPKETSGYVSVFAHSERAEGVYLKGLKYELDNAVLTNTYPLGVSNEFIGKESRISVRNGRTGNIKCGRMLCGDGRKICHGGRKGICTG